MLIARWGNSLAIRIPADVVRELGLKEGDDVQLHSIKPGVLALARDDARRDAIEGLRKFRGRMPADFKFDREEANAR